MHETKWGVTTRASARASGSLNANKESASIVFRQCKKSRVAAQSVAAKLEASKRSNIKNSKAKSAFAKRDLKWDSEPVRPYWVLPVECVITAPAIGDESEVIADDKDEPTLDMGISKKSLSCENFEVAVGSGQEDTSECNMKKEACVENQHAHDALYNLDHIVKSDPDIGSMVLQHYLSPDPYLFGLEMVETGWRPFKPEYAQGGCLINEQLRDTDNVNNNSVEKKHNCPMCHVKFSSNSNLTRHMRLHTGERPFVCKVCESRFTDSSRLKEHTRIHTGEKPFACRTCQMRFRTSSHLNRHNRVHTDKRPYNCQFCGSRFGDPTKLKTHMRVHTGEKPFSCELCDAKFNNSSNLNRHLHIHNKYDILLKQRKGIIVKN